MLNFVHVYILYTWNLRANYDASRVYNYACRSRLRNWNLNFTPYNGWKQRNKMIGETNHLTSVKLGCCILCSYYRYHRSSGTERSRESKKYLPPYNFPHRRMMQVRWSEFEWRRDSCISIIRCNILYIDKTCSFENICVSRDFKECKSHVKNTKDRIHSMYFYSNNILSFDKDRQVSIIKAVIVIPLWIIISMRKRVFEKKNLKQLLWIHW